MDAEVQVAPALTDLKTVLPKVAPYRVVGVTGSIMIECPNPEKPLLIAVKLLPPSGS